MQLPILRRMGASTATQRQRATASPNYRDGEFRSHEPTHVVATSEAEGPGSILTTMVREFGRGRPRGTVPLVRPRHPHEPADLAVTWYGHATSVVELDGRRFLLDPVFGKRASPFGKRKTCEGGCGSTSSQMLACSTRGCGADRWRT